MTDSLREYLCAVTRVLNAKIPDETRRSTMRNVWDYLEIGLLKMLFSTSAAEYMEDKGKRRHPVRGEIATERLI